MIGIYKITSPSGRIYIGESKDIIRRWSEYMSLQCCKGQRKLYRSFMKYGVQNHKFEKIMECAYEDLKYYERCFQEIYVAVENGLNCLYTSTEEKKCQMDNESKIKSSNTHKEKWRNGELKLSISVFKKGQTPWNKGVKMSEEYCKINSEAQKKLYQNGYINPCKGLKRSDDSKKQQSATRKSKIENGEINIWNKGKKVPQNSGENHFASRKVIDVDTNIVYGSILECQRQTNYKKLGVKLNGKRKNNTPIMYLEDYNKLNNTNK
jgi:group I intron endonuclease